jgi:hypothetical protein
VTSVHTLSISSLSLSSAKAWRVGSGSDKKPTRPAAEVRAGIFAMMCCLVPALASIGSRGLRDGWRWDVLQRAGELLRRRAGGKGVGGCVGVFGALSYENDRRREAERCVGVMERVVMGGRWQ